MLVQTSAVSTRIHVNVQKCQPKLNLDEMYSKKAKCALFRLKTSIDENGEKM